MRVCIWSFQRRRSLLILLLCAAIGWLLLRYPLAASNGVSAGLAVCAKQLVPSLFPFLVLTGFLIRSGTLAHTERGLARLAATLHLPAVSGLTVWLISVLGGYPAGASALCEQLARGDIDADTARHRLPHCIHAGPAFVLGGVGVGVLGSAKAGVLLLAAHLVASLLTAWLFHTPAKPLPAVRCTPLPIGAAVTESIHAATAVLLGMCGCIVSACCAVSVMDAMGLFSANNPFLRAAVTSVLEVTTGCIASAATHRYAPLFIGAALGFGGLAVIGQIAALGAHAFMDRRFWWVRLTHAALGGGLSALAFAYLAPDTASVAALATLTRPNATPLTALCGAVLLMTMSVLFLLTLPSAQQNRG